MKTSEAASEMGEQLRAAYERMVVAQGCGDKFAEAILMRTITRLERGDWLKGRRGLGVDGFFKRIRLGASECWYWISSVDRLGYGWAGKRMRAHRYSWVLFNGDIPDGMHVLHRCDVRSCVNPGHLFLGTHKENMRDMDLKGRRNPARGERVRIAKLTASAVAEMRRMYSSGEFTLSELAANLGVTVSAAHAAITRKTWRHI